MSEGYDPEIGDQVEVLWDDANWWSDQTTETDWDDECMVYTVGFVVKVTDKSVFIASEVQKTNGTYRGVTRIPRAYVIGISKLEQPRVVPELVKAEKVWGANSHAG